MLSTGLPLIFVFQYLGQMHYVLYIKKSFTKGKYSLKIDRLAISLGLHMHRERTVKIISIAMINKIYVFCGPNT